MDLEELKKQGSIVELEEVDEDLASLLIERAEHELRLARALLNLSSDKKEKVNLQVEEEDTFYSAVISHSYYAIFYGAKSILSKNKIKTDVPNIHNATLEAFSHYLVESGKLDVELLQIYKKMIVRADVLLGLFKTEKRKRADFTYKTLPQANLEPAKESIDNAKKFLMNIKNILK